MYGALRLPPHSSLGLLSLLRVGSRRGLTQEQCLVGTGLEVPPAKESCVDPAHELQVAANIIRLTGNAAQLGVEAGRHTPIGQLGVFGFALLSSLTVLSAIELSCKYAVVGGAFVRTFVHRDEHEVRIVFDDSAFPPTLADFVLMRDLAAYQAVCQFLLPADLKATLFLRAGADNQGFQTAAKSIAYVPNLSKIVWDNDQSWIALPDDAAHLPLPQADPVTAELCRNRCRELLERHEQRTGVAAQIRDLMAENPRHSGSMLQIAMRMGLDERTLRRRLAKENTSFRAIRDEFRSVMAKELLSYGLNVQQVASRLGYSESSGFVRAFSRWHGAPPTQFRPENTDATQPVSAKPQPSDAW